MNRRDIINILFNRHFTDKKVFSEKSQFEVSRTYLKPKKPECLLIEEKYFSGLDIVKADISNREFFSITLNLKPAEYAGKERIVIARLLLENQDQPLYITIGLKNRCLFINEEIIDRTVSEVKLYEGMQFVLSVSPQQHGNSFTKLKAIDQYGLTVSVLKSQRLYYGQWKGAIIPGLPINSVCVQGTRNNP